MKRVIPFFMTLFLLVSCQERQPAPAEIRVEKPYSIGIFQVIDSPTLNEVRRGILQALSDAGLQEGRDVSISIRNALGDISEVQRIAQKYVEEKIDLIVPLSTPCLQAALIETQTVPIVFSSVANPFLVGAGKSADDHLSFVTGIASAGPIQQTLSLIRELLPRARRVGTLWTPSELNSEYYLEVARTAAVPLGFEIVSVPVRNTNEVLISSQILINKGIDLINQLSDNTINASFETLGRVAEENSIPLFGGFLLSTELGACAAMGYDFFEMGYKTGQLILEVKKGVNPGRIPIQYMDRIQLYINLESAARQGVHFSEKIVDAADRVIRATSLFSRPS